MTDSKSCCIPDNDMGAVPVRDSPYRTIKTTSANHQFAALPGGWFAMGAENGPHPEDGEGPVRDVFVDPFSIAVATVTNQDYSNFADATGYKTVAERQGFSFVFHAFISDPDQWQAPRQAPWWRKVPQAHWCAPFGVKSNIDGLLDHPVTHVTLEDAYAYCAWSGTRLPTEAEWEFAARGGITGKAFPWGDELEPDGEHFANVWQGHFPYENTKEDGYLGTAPALSYAPNGYGLYAMTGNVWEWTADRFTHLHSPRPVQNPGGPLNGNHFVAKGGSYLCHASYCSRYRTSSRQALLAQTVAGNIGFRVVR